MKHNISKELFEAVYNCDITTDKDMLNVYKSINIYEFAFKCKEWAFNNGRYVLESKSYSVRNYKFTKGAFCYTHFHMDGMGNSHWADTEVEAIIKACEWILKHKGNQCTK